MMHTIKHFYHTFLNNFRKAENKIICYSHFSLPSSVWIFLSAQVMKFTQMQLTIAQNSCNLTIMLTSAHLSRNLSYKICLLLTSNCKCSSSGIKYIYRSNNFLFLTNFFDQRIYNLNSFCLKKLSMSREASTL